MLLTALSGFAQGVKIQSFTTNSGPVVTNIVVSLSSNLQPNRLSATNGISGLRVYAATNGTGGFWLNPSTISPGVASNVIDVAAGSTAIIVDTNALLRTLYNPGVQTNDTRLLTLSNRSSRVTMNVITLSNLTGVGISPIEVTNMRAWAVNRTFNVFLADGTSPFNVPITGGVNVAYIAGDGSGLTNVFASGGTGPFNGTFLGAFTATANMDMDGWIITNLFGLRPQVGQTIEIQNAVIDGEFTGNGAALTNVPRQWVPVSSRGIINGLSTVVNAGLPYGPDTPGTATSGLQEAYNATVAGRTSIGPGIISVPVVLDGGDYFLTNTLVVSNLFTTDFSLEGFAGMTGSRLIAAGTNSACLIVRGGFNSYLPSSLTMPVGVRLNGVTFASVLDDTNALVTLTNNYHVDIENCNFTSWMVMTNQDWGSGNSIVGNTQAPPIASSLVGLVTGNGGENGTHVVRCNFGGLGVGAVILSDHIYMSGTTFSLIGLSWDGNGTHTSKWPTNHPYSSGAAIIRYPGLNSRYTDPYFYSCRVGLFVNYTNNSVDAEAQYLDNPIFEGVDYEIATSATNRVFFYTGGPNGITPDVPTAKAYVNTTNGYSMNNSGRLVVRKFVYDNNGTTPFASIYATKFEGTLFVGGASGLSNLPPVGLAATNTGTAGQAYHWLTSSTGYWATVSGSGTPGGANTQVQFNDAGSFGGDGGLTYNKTTDTLTINGGLLVGAVAGDLSVGGDISFDGTNYGNGFGLTELNATNLIGLVQTANLGTGSADNTKFLRGDLTWAVPAGGSGSGIATNGGSGQNNLLTNLTVISSAVDKVPLIINTQPGGNATDLFVITNNGAASSKFFRVDNNGVLYANGAGITNLGGIKQYVALISQSGTAAPTATVVNNTLGGTVTLARTDVGTYTATLTGAFTVSKTVIRATASAQTCNLTAIRTDANTITFKTFDVEIVGLSDDMLTTASFEILVYP